MAANIGLALSQDGAVSKEDFILFVGRLEKQKGLFYLLEAFKGVLKIKPQIRLKIIGQGSQKEQLVAYAHSNHMQNNVIFEPYKTDIVEDFSKARLTVLSSLYEGFPNVLVESIALGTPVVAFNCKSGPAEIIRDGINGFLVRYLDTADLTEKICKALDYSWDFQKITASADPFREEHIIQQYIKVIKQ
jgi:glycosyltransferase involved in cell wall biosynthesis